ncbi:MAG: COX15/CtaA family protein [Candidatus Nanopelagicales bacterium]
MTATPDATSLGVPAEAPPTSGTDGRAAGWVRGVYVANLVAQTGIVLTGGLVRVTGSGLGCPTWPECVEGSIAPTSAQTEGFHKFIEFGNRTLTGVLGLLALAALVAAVLDGRRRVRAGLLRRGPLLALAAIPLLGTVAQAVLGGITVLTGLNPVIVAGHFLLSMAIIGGCVVLVQRAGEPGDRPLVWIVRPEVRWLGWLLVAVGAVTLVLGTVVTGSGPHSGDSGADSRLPFDPRTVSWLHADVVLLFLGLVAGMVLALRLVDAPSAARRRGWWLVGAVLLQGFLGYLQYFTGLPWPVVAAHMLGACLVWIAVVRLQLGLRTRGQSTGQAPRVPAA